MLPLLLGALRLSAPLVLGSGSATRAALLRELDVERANVVLLTAHRRENHGAPLRRIFGAVRELSARASAHRRPLRIVFPVHRNPAVSEVAHEVRPCRDRVCGRRARGRPRPNAPARTRS